MLDVGRHPNIKLLAYSELEKIEGEAGNFTATVKRKARYVDENKCTGCGACAQACPTPVLDLYNEGHAQRKAIYSWFAQGIPSTHAIDPDHCRVLTGKKCGICQKKCEADAIDFEQKDAILELSVGAIIVSTGYDVFDPAKIPEYRYTQLDNVITAMEFERFLSASGPTAGHIYRPSDRKVKATISDLEKKVKKSQKALDRFEKNHGIKSDEFYSAYKAGSLNPGEDLEKDQDNWAKKYAAHLENAIPLEDLKEKAKGFTTAKNIAFIQCVGSRDLRFYPFCSGYCCMHSIKEAIIAHEHDNDTHSVIFGMDIRAVGKGFEEYKIRGGNNSNVSYKRSRVAEITKNADESPVLIYEDTQKQKVEKQAFDLVVLATACGPVKGAQKISDTLGIDLDRYGFFKTDPANPLDTSKEGIYVCGCAHSPMDIPESVAQASSAAARAAQTVIKKNDKKAS
ncbi:4Fe-4S dicluster domain-containing protein [Desulfobacula toluolica]|uniref:HdlA3: heterodisulfide reductase-like protein, iron-sulfur subunit n=1 Tax=Desulfobacula toluolica (strain DSM 7467 / Tol2) TaxID=651182 RepID=K0NE93_DESTT|nr:4Fe-4S dicluster domain-containing protein [Desulfobacula toluolica]CCK79326.1 HdlA3: heterodisulfide reductase-like protein, iron-sulfur subunit, fragment [Desulfobacula toluolica Tol2]